MLPLFMLEISYKTLCGENIMNMLFEKMHDSQSAPHTYFNVILQYLGSIYNFGIKMFNHFLGIQLGSIDFCNHYSI